MEKLIFGPVPSRRLGKSLGINNIPHKVCSYSCAYCQVGKAGEMQVHRREFYPTATIIRQLEYKLNCLATRDFPDYITLVPDGEPTLDIHLGELILKLKSYGIAVAVISNSSLLYQPEVHDELLNADYVSLKVDTVIETTWHKVNKPHKELNHNLILQGILDFSKDFKGILVTESMLLKEMNDSAAELKALALFLHEVNPEVSYIAIPTRPLAFGGVFPAEEAAVAMAYELFSRKNLKTELLTGYEGNAFASSDDFASDLLSITAVHPMRRDAVMELMAKTETPALVLEQLIDNELIEKVYFNDQEFFLRKFGRRD